MNRWDYIFLVGLICCHTGPLPAGGAPSDSLSQLNRNLYETSLLQLETLLAARPPVDSLILDLRGDAEKYARQGDWLTGEALLRVALDLCRGEESEGRTDPPGQKTDPAVIPGKRGPSTMEIQASPAWQLETGLDYSQQEFEISLIENDSILVEELQNPYVYLSFFQPIIDGAGQLDLRHRLRFDERYLTYELTAIGNLRLKNWDGGLTWEGGYYHIRDGFETDFLENRAQLSLSTGHNLSGRWYFEARARHKRYFAESDVNRDILSGDLFAGFYRAVGRYGLWNSGLSATVYRESGGDGYQYWEQRLSSDFRRQSAYNSFWEVNVAGVYNDFENRFFDESFPNSYWQWNAGFHAEVPLKRRGGFENRLDLENRRHRTADAINPNYVNLSLEGIPKVYFDEFSAIGAGAFAEKQIHQVGTGVDGQVFVEQEDYTAYGLVLRMEMVRTSGLLLSAEYRLSRRNYPNALDSFLQGFYSDRRVHSINVLGWIPLSKRWQIQLFANYDNDQDRNDERNDTRSTLMNAGLIYRF